MFRTLGKIVTVSLSLVLFSPSHPGTAATGGVAHRLGRDPAGSAESAVRSIDSSGLLDSALDASRSGNLTELAELSELCNQQAARLRVLVDPRSSPAERGELVLRYLHEHLLYGVYAPRCEDVADTLRSGDFNCVTATILYVWLCREADLEVQVLSLPGHVYCRLAADPTAEIQTTSPRGFAAPPESACPAGSIADASTAIHGGKSRLLSDRALVAKVYYNRGVTLLERNRFADAFAVLQTSVEMDEADPLSRENLIACLNNWALAECDRGQYERAARLLRQGLQLDAAHPALLDNDLHVHSLWLSRLCRQHDFPRALEVLDAGNTRRPDAALFSRGPLTVYRLWYEHLVRADQQGAAEQLLSKARTRYPQADLAWNEGQKS